MRRLGFTLVEVLVALAIAGILMVALAGFVRSARGAAVAAESSSETAVTLRLATELLREELLLAGSAPWPLPVAGGDITGLEGAQTPAQFLAQGVQVSNVAGGHAVRLVYIDDRVAGQPVARHLTFEARPDSQGQPQLYRRAGASPRQPWVAGVERLTVMGGIDQAGAAVAVSSMAGRRLRALWVEFQAFGEVAVALFELPHRPLVVGP